MFKLHAEKMIPLAQFFKTLHEAITNFLTIARNFLK